MTVPLDPIPLDRLLQHPKDFCQFSETYPAFPSLYKGKGGQTAFPDAIQESRPTWTKLAIRFLGFPKIRRWS
jgi:hypothetical protein